MKMTLELLNSMANRVHQQDESALEKYKAITRKAAEAVGIAVPEDAFDEADFKVGFNLGLLAFVRVVAEETKSREVTNDPS